MRKSKAPSRSTRGLALLIVLTITACNLPSGQAFTLTKPPTFQTQTKPTRTQLVLRSTSSSSNNHHVQLPSTYDLHLPASLRGEAIRSALKSDRGVCFDFTSRNTPQTNVGVVTVNGQGTLNFLNSKLTSSFPTSDQKDTSRVIVDETMRRVNHEIVVEVGQVSESCLLTGKGRLLDLLRVPTFPQMNEDGTQSWQATLITSPGHAGSQLFDRLDPYIFPMDQIKLTNLCSNSKDEDVRNEGGRMDTKVLTLAATNLENAKSSLIRSIESLLPALGLSSQDLESMTLFPKKAKECIRLTSTHVETGGVIQITILQHCFLPQCIAQGYTLIIQQEQGSSSSSSNEDGFLLSFGERLWKRYTSFDNTNGPVELGPLEYDTLRIEGGQPGFGFEMMGDGDGSDSVAIPKDKSDVEDSKSGVKVKSSPLELHMKDLVDETKGCYQGQEGIASLLKNKRGIPRTLYSVHFPEESNFYNDGQEDTEQYSNHDNPNRVNNLTKNPLVGDKLYVLGSDEQINVGTITSIAEKGGTSQPETVGLVMVRREETIRKKMGKMGIDLELEDSMFDEEDGIFYPPPMDGLQGLEVVLEGSFTQGVLRAVPSRRLPRDQNLFEAGTWQPLNDSSGSEDNGENFSQDFSELIEIPEDFQGIPFGKELDDEVVDVESVELSGIDEKEEDNAEEELEEAIKAAAIAAEEAKRKAEKLEILKQRAEMAMAKRKEKREHVQNMKVEETQNEIDTAEAERKAKKMEMLQKQASAAIEARRKKKLQQ